MPIVEALIEQAALPHCKRACKWRWGTREFIAFSESETSAHLGLSHHCVLPILARFTSLGFLSWLLLTLGKLPSLGSILLVSISLFGLFLVLDLLLGILLSHHARFVRA